MFPEITPVDLAKFNFKHLKELAHSLNVSTDAEPGSDAGSDAGEAPKKLSRWEIVDEVEDVIKKYGRKIGTCAESTLKDLATGIDMDYDEWVKDQSPDASLLLRTEMIRVVNEKISDAKAAMLKGTSTCFSFPTFLSLVS